MSYRGTLCVTRECIVQQSACIMSYRGTLCVTRECIVQQSACIMYIQGDSLCYKGVYSTAICMYNVIQCLYLPRQKTVSSELLFDYEALYNPN